MFKIFRRCVLRNAPYVRTNVRRVMFGTLRIDMYGSTVCYDTLQLRYVTLCEGGKQALSSKNLSIRLTVN